MTPQLWLSQVPQILAETFKILTFFRENQEEPANREDLETMGLQDLR